MTKKKVTLEIECEFADVEAEAPAFASVAVLRIVRLIETASALMAVLTGQKPKYSIKAFVEGKLVCTYNEETPENPDEQEVQE